MNNINSYSSEKKNQNLYTHTLVYLSTHTTYKYIHAYIHSIYPHLFVNTKHKYIVRAFWFERKQNVNEIKYKLHKKLSFQFYTDARDESKRRNQKGNLQTTKKKKIWNRKRITKPIWYFFFRKLNFLADYSQ